MQCSVALIWIATSQGCVQREAEQGGHNLRDGGEGSASPLHHRHHPHNPRGHAPRAVPEGAELYLTF